MHLLSAPREKRKMRRKRKEIARERRAWIKKERARRGTGGSRLLCLPAWHVPGSHDVNQRTCLSRGRELFLGQVQRSIPRGMIDAPAACNGPRISPPRMRKLRDREKDSYKPIELYRVSRNFRMFFFFFLVEDWLNRFKILPWRNQFVEKITCIKDFDSRIWNWDEA